MQKRVFILKLLSFLILLNVGVENLNLNSLVQLLKREGKRGE